MRRVCEWCGSRPVPGSVCPWSVPCPRCKAKPGVRCKRPSGHEAAKMHRDRWQWAEQLDADAGITYPEVTS